MNYNEEDSLDKEFFLNIKRDRVTKDTILDETYKKALQKREKKTKEKTTPKNKPFYKTGILLIIIAMICFGIINYMPWFYIRYDGEDGTKEQIFYKDFKMEDINYEEIQKILSSNNDTHYLGFSINDFKNIPTTISYYFIGLGAIGFLFFLLQMFDKKLKLSLDSFSIIHSIFSAVIMSIGLVILLIMMRFISSYILLYYNMPLIETYINVTNVIVVFPVVFIIIFVAAIIVKLSFSIMKINFREIEKKAGIKGYENPFFIHKNRSKN